jgi:hypothetical protein
VALDAWGQVPAKPAEIDPGGATEFATIGSAAKGLARQSGADPHPGMMDKRTQQSATMSYGRGCATNK